jgi:pyruvate, water dikinase
MTAAVARSFRFVRWFENLRIDDVPLVGGKNASLGELIQTLTSKGVRVPGGFALTSDAYWHYLDASGLRPKLDALLARHANGEASLTSTGLAIRELMLAAHFPDDIALEVREAYTILSERYGRTAADVAVRSSATAEDLPNASFAGQQESYLNVVGSDAVLEACRDCFASLFTDRAIAYRNEQGFAHMDVALSVGVQKMVRSDKASSGVMFSVDTETGFPKVVVVNSAWGLGENVVQGAVTPDEFMVFKPNLGKPGLRPIIHKRLGDKETRMVYAESGPHKTRSVACSEHQRNSFSITDDEVLALAQWSVIIEDHYGRPMDMEWAKDGDTGEMYIVQARPETVQSQKKSGTIHTYKLLESADPIVIGLSVGEAIATGPAFVVNSREDADIFPEGAILVTDMTSPDWVPVMRRAAAIVTDQGGRTCHAAIVSRELGVPAVVGCGDATRKLKHGQLLTVSCAEGDRGLVYPGTLKFESREVDFKDSPETKTRILLNIASPSAAFHWWQLPAEGIGLARTEFIINGTIKIHPRALVEFEQLTDLSVKAEIEALTRGYADKKAYFVENLARGIAHIAASQYPQPVIVRMSDFKSNEYADLVGGRIYEPHEENPMLGFRGAARYYSASYGPAFALECQAVKMAREVLGMTNVKIMIPFCRTPSEGDRVLAEIAKNGLARGENGLEVYVMAEIPSNILRAKEFAERFDGFSIGSNDLTQLVLGVDRDSSDMAHQFDERDEAVKIMIRQLITVAHAMGKPVGICGQAPSDYPDFAQFLVECGIDSISLNPDSVLNVRKAVAETEARLGR